MKILYRSRYKIPSDGDVKILKDGTIFFRKQIMINGMYVVSYGKPSYEWYSENNEKVIEYKLDYEDKTKKIFLSSSETKSKPKVKTRIVKFDFTKERDRIKYEKITGIPVLSNTTIKSAKLELTI